MKLVLNVIKLYFGLKCHQHAGKSCGRRRMNHISEMFEKLGNRLLFLLSGIGHRRLIDNDKDN